MLRTGHGVVDYSSFPTSVISVNQHCLCSGLGRGRPSHVCEGFRDRHSFSVPIIHLGILHILKICCNHSNLACSKILQVQQEPGNKGGTIERGCQMLLTRLTESHYCLPCLFPILSEASLQPSMLSWSLDPQFWG